ncbi:peptide-methionine (R)-S-oxide reductase MsrB [Leptobacterium sp. I13]|uniref:peptide-methionine (R)-S-oxide reductase MsrB n=1 Tax=Leptobacterium meishanense TaxID=3128904 RepID=UPI0030EBA75B
MKKIALLITLSLIFNCNGNAQKKKEKTEEKKTYKVSKPDEEWKAQLSNMEYYVLRQKGTERATTGIYNKFYEEGTYVCAACGTKLYESEYKYDSGSGWPAFDRGYDENIEYKIDTSLGMTRTEVLCASCGGHLGHVFDDGPRNTTGKRHCVNSVSLNFIPAKNEN